MDVVIKPLTPDLTLEYFDFFDNRAFSDREGAYCYCTWFHFDCTIEEHYKNGRNSMRSQAAAYIKNGQLNGYLAFVDGVSIGWCNADNKAAYQRFKTDPLIYDDNTKKIKAVVCFEIAPKYRGNGIATALLKKVIQDASSKGYTAVESYPKLFDKYEPYDYSGPIRLYEKTGFTEIARRDNMVVMRKNL